jgi:UDP-glucose 4-epimerase
MKVLVTGGAGFIGSHLADKLLKDGHGVVVIDNESTGKRHNVPAGARYVKGDVRRLEDLDTAFSGGVDAVCHVAGQVSLALSFVDPVDDLRTNIEGTVNVLSACVKHRVPRLLYASSMTVYGCTDVLPIPETAHCAPISYYGVTKYAAERYVHATAERVDLGFDFHVTSFRMYNVYGPRQALDNPYQGVLGIFVGNVLRGEPLTIFGDGRQSRDFIYIGDVVEAWSRALTASSTYGKVFNLGSGRRLSINALARHTLAAFGQRPSQATIRHAPGRSGEQRHVEAAIHAVRKTLSWTPRVPFERGLAATCRWAASVTDGAARPIGRSLRRAHG